MDQSEYVRLPPTNKIPYSKAANGSINHKGDDQVTIFKCFCAPYWNYYY